MRCEVARNLMSAYIDNEINQIEKKALEKHLTECTECREEYELLLEVVTGCNSIEEQELPQGFDEELRQKLANEKDRSESNNKIISFFNRNNKWKIASGLVAAVLVLALAVGGAYSFILDKKGMEYGQNNAAYHMTEQARGDGNYSVSDQSAPMGDTASIGSSNASVGVENKSKLMKAAPEAPSAAPSAGSIASVDQSQVNVKFSTALTTDNAAASGENMLLSRAAPSGRKVIRTGNLTIKVEKLDSKIDQIKKLAEQSGGYVENSNVDNVTIDTVSSPRSGEEAGKSSVKTANVAIRVPADSFDTTFDTIKKMGTLDNENVNGSDITYQYRDTYTRCENLKVQEKRLLELMAKAKNVDELLKIENELNRVRTDIEVMTGDLKKWDDLVDLSTIYINLTEVKAGELNKIDVPNVWSKAYKGFIGAINKIVLGAERFFIFLVTAVPYIIILGILLTAAILLARRIIAKRKINK